MSTSDNPDLEARIEALEYLIRRLSPSGGGGITQLTQDVLAGPGSGAQAATVVRLQNRALAATAPTDAQVIGWSAGGSTWTPMTPPILGVFQSLQPGGTLTITGAPSVSFVSVNGTGAANTLNLPAAGAAVNGQVVVVQINSGAPGGGTGAPNLTLNPGTGNQINDLVTPGGVLVAGAAQTVTGPGAMFWLKYASAVISPFTTAGWHQIVSYVTTLPP